MILFTLKAILDLGHIFIRTNVLHYFIVMSDLYMSSVLYCGAVTFAVIWVGKRKDFVERGNKSYVTEYYDTFYNSKYLSRLTVQ